MRVSIAMTTYNGEIHLKEQLQSFVNQIKLPDELVICDDCSTDCTVKILQEFKLSAPFEVKIFINEKNLGFNKNFEKVIGLCTGDLIFISDHDDLWLDNKISTMYKFILSKEKAFMAMNDCEMTDFELSRTGISKIQQVIKYQGTIDGFIPGCCSVFLSDYKSLIFPFPESFSYDSWISFIGVNTDSRFILEEILQLYRRYGENTTNHPFNSLNEINIASRYLRGLQHIFSAKHKIEKRKYNLDNLKGSEELKIRINSLKNESTDRALVKNLLSMESALAKKINRYESLEILLAKSRITRFLESNFKLILRKMTWKDYFFVNL